MSPGRREPPPLGTVLLVAIALLGADAGLGPAGHRLDAGNWPQWRGPEGTGVSREKGLPISWGKKAGEQDGSLKENPVRQGEAKTGRIAWRCALPEWGNSTPAIWGDSIFVTAHEKEALLLVKISKATGAIEWTRQVGTGTADVLSVITKSGDQRLNQKFHSTQNLASPSPVTDGERVVVHFGNGDFASYDFSGREEWKRNLQADYGRYTVWWGHANSPVLHQNLVISVCMQDSLTDLQPTPSPSYVVAHDARSGKEVWKTPRMTGAVSEPCDAYTTPLLRRTKEGTEMIVVGGTWVDAYDPSSGRQLWCLPGVGGNRTITGPTLGADMLYFTVGMRGPVTALRLGKTGRLTEEDIAWRYDVSTPDSPSVVLWNELVFTVNEGGIAACLDAKTGERHWRERLKGDYRASPIAADERIYFLSTSGLTTVVAASSRFEKLSENEIEDTTFASLAVSDGRIYIRGRKALYCIGGESPPPGGAGCP